MSFVQTLHGEIRWIVALIAFVAIIRFALGWWRGAEYKGIDRGLMAAYTGFLDLNFLLGLILLFGLGDGFPSYRIEHAVTMFIAVGLAHSAAAWRESDDAALKFRNNLLVVTASLAVVILGVVRLRGGWLW
jgi:hypothetical protein